MTQSAAPGRDMHISPDNFIGARNFSNKLWNATRFALMNLAGVTKISLPGKESWELADRWILHRFGQVIDQCTDFMETFDLDAAARLLYDFFWADFCDWYVEIIKPRLQNPNASNGSSKSKETAQAVMATVLEGTLRMLHPIMPFITEELWQKLPRPVDENNDLLMG